MSYENFVHEHLILILNSMNDNINIDIKILEKIAKEIKIVLKQHDQYTLQFLNKPLGKLLSTDYKNYVEQIIKDFEDKPTIVMNILIWYEYDLIQYENIIQKCFKKLENNIEYLINFLTTRLKKKDELGIKLAIDLLKQKIESQFDNLLKQKIEQEKLERYEQEKLERYEQEKRKQALANFSFRASSNSLGWGFNSLNPFLFNFSSSLLNNYTNYLKEREKIEYNDFKKLLSSFSSFDLYSLDPNSIFNKKRKLLILLFYLSKEQKNINDYLLKLIESDSFEFKIELIKLYYLENKQLPKIAQEKINSNEELKKIFENYKFVSSFKSLQLVSAIKTILQYSPIFCYIVCKAIKRYYKALGAKLLETLIRLSINYIENSINDGYYLVELIINYARKGNTTIIGPLSGMARIDDLSKITLKQKQILTLIDCACELNPELYERKDVLEDFDPDSFVRLQQIINDINQFRSIRKLALEIYCEKINDNNSFNLLINLLDDGVLCYSAARIIIKRNEQKDVINKILSSDNLEIGEKKLLLADTFNYNFDN